jgi:hypothetical protein
MGFGSLGRVQHGFRQAGVACARCALAVLFVFFFRDL